MNFKLALAVAILFGPLVLIVPKAAAHFPETDGTMTVVLHIDPNDQPVAAQPSTLNFIYEDQLQKFNTQKCRCEVKVSEQNKLVFSGPATPANSSPISVGILPITFKKPDVYRINLSGTPDKSGDFVPFSVSWNVRVPSNVSYYGNHNDKYYIGGFVLLAATFMGTIGYFIYNDFKEE